MAYESALMKAFLYKRLWLKHLNEHLVVSLYMYGNVVVVLQPVLISIAHVKMSLATICSCQESCVLWFGNCHVSIHER